MSLYFSQFYKLHLNEPYFNDSITQRQNLGHPMRTEYAAV